MWFLPFFGKGRGGKFFVFNNIDMKKIQRFAFTDYIIQQNSKVVKRRRINERKKFFFRVCRENYRGFSLTSERIF